MPRCMSRIAPGKRRRSSNARTLSARISFGEELRTSPPVPVESVLAIQSHPPFVRRRSCRAEAKKLFRNELRRREHMTAQGVRNAAVRRENDLTDLDSGPAIIPLAESHRLLSGALAGP